MLRLRNGALFYLITFGQFSVCCAPHVQEFHDGGVQETEGGVCDRVVPFCCFHASSSQEVMPERGAVNVVVGEAQKKELDAVASKVCPLLS